MSYFSPHWESDAGMRLVVSGPWLIYTLLMLIYLARVGEITFYLASDLVACIFGAVATVTAIARLKRTRMLAALAALVFFASYIARLVDWGVEGIPGIQLGDSFMERIWSFYTMIYSILIGRLRNGEFVSGIELFFVDAIMPVVEIVIVVLFLVTRPNLPLNAEPPKRPG